MDNSEGSQGSERSRKRKSAEGTCKPSKRIKGAHASSTVPGGIFQCFTINGDHANMHRRSVFSSQRKAEVRGIRQKGACLRCRLLKRACSGDDPCKTCIVAARAAAGSRALMWMECIRPSFQAMNIFNKQNLTADPNRIECILDDLLDDDVSLDFHIPFSLNVEAASAHLASWLTDDALQPTFSVVGVFSCSTNTNLLQNALDPGLGKDLRLFVHLTTRLYTMGTEAGYHQYTEQDVRQVRDRVGNRLLLALDPLLRPSELEGTNDKLNKLKSLFLLLLGTTVGMRYSSLSVDDEADDCIQEDSKKDALLRLLCHYLIYIGKATALLEPSSDEKTLVNKCRTTWDKPAAFTWSSTKGLEMHYRIQPAADWIVSSAEDKSMNSIDLDLSELDVDDEFTVNADLIKCMRCGTLWDEVNDSRLCQQCITLLSEEVPCKATLRTDLKSLEAELGLESTPQVLQPGEHATSASSSMAYGVQELDLYQPTLAFEELFASFASGIPDNSSSDLESLACRLTDDSQDTSQDNSFLPTEESSCPVLSQLDNLEFDPFDYSRAQNDTHLITHEEQDSLSDLGFYHQSIPGGSVNAYNQFMPPTEIPAAKLGPSPERTSDSPFGPSETLPVLDSSNLARNALVYMGPGMTQNHTDASLWRDMKGNRCRHIRKPRTHEELAGATYNFQCMECSTFCGFSQCTGCGSTNIRRPLA